jgi:hypothetical protein
LNNVQIFEAWQSNQDDEVTTLMKHILLPVSIFCAAAFSPAYATSINFDGTGAPCFFAGTSPLSNQYAGQGVTFSAPVAGLSILNECGNFGFNALSGTDFLAFNSGLTTQTETLQFSTAVSNVSIWAATGLSGSFTITAFDALGVSLATQTIAGTNAWQELVVSGSGITSVQLSTDAPFGALDNLQFTTTNTQVAEPGSLALLGLGLLGFGFGRRKNAQ